MRKILVWMLVLLTLLAGCAKKPEPEPEVQTPLFTAETMPRIDGSTATIPLSEGMVKTLLGYTPEQAKEYVKHNTTHFAYENLINGDCDVIFVTPPSAPHHSPNAGMILPKNSRFSEKVRWKIANIITRKMGMPAHLFVNTLSTLSDLERWS